jgi:predicted anti-sigma-YlaC factor YlaD
MELIPLLCERACRWASLRVDGELSELESALLDDHLGRCRSCRVFASGVEDVVAALAAARLERPAPLALVIPRRRRSLPLLRSAAAATLIAVAGIAALVTGVAAQGQSARAVKPVAMLQGADSPNELRELRRSSLIDQGRVIPRNKRTPGESY